MRTRQLFVSVVGILAAVSFLTACGGSTKRTVGLTTSYTSGTAAAASARTPLSKQEIVRAKGCLEREGVRPARRTRYRPRVPRGVNEVTRDGLPMTPGEYETAVRKCVATPRPSSSGAHRK
jgi:hypothetical protein